MRPCHEKEKLDDCALLWTLFCLSGRAAAQFLQKRRWVCTSEDSSYTTPVLGVLITQVCTSEDSSYPVTGSLFHCQWPPFFVSKAFFSGKIGSLFHEKLVPNIIDKNKRGQR